MLMQMQVQVLGHYSTWLPVWLHTPDYVDNLGQEAGYNQHNLQSLSILVDEREHSSAPLLLLPPVHLAPQTLLLQLLLLQHPPSPVHETQTMVL